MIKPIVNQVCSSKIGPHKGYMGLASFDKETGEFYGEVIGTRDTITFQAPFEELTQAFVDSVEDYLEFCEQRGESPEKPFSGKFMVRIPSDLHRQASLLAESFGESLNQFSETAIRNRVESESPSGDRKKKRAS